MVAPRISVTVVATLLGLLSVVSADFGSFNVFSEHPLKDLLDNGNGIVKPVPLHQYYYTDSDGSISMKSRTMYKPRYATYKVKRGETIFEKADALIRAGQGNKDLTLKLNRNASVVVVLNGKWSGSTTPVVSQPAGYKGIAKVQRLAGDGSVKRGYAVKTYPRKIEDREEYIVVVPPPQSFVVDGLEGPSQYTILLLDPETDKAFDEPVTPESLKALIGGNVSPLTRCPDQLHSMWQAYSNDTSDPHNFVDNDLQGDQIPHSTWHPIIDPVYYCSYGHDHGSYPGPFYKPAYTHTAWHTQDSTQHDDRQDESDAGFKTFAFVSGTLHWIVTVHMQLGNPRRLSTRFHTIQLAIFDVVGNDWTPKVELNYKQDYGFAGTKVSIGDGENKIVPLNADEATVKDSLNKQRRFRQLNVGKWSETCTFGSDQTIKTRPHKNRQGRGSNEHWVTTLNTCGAEHFKIDVSAPATGLKTCDNSASGIADDVDAFVDEYNGFSIRRTFSSQKSGLSVGSGMCSFSTDIPQGTEESPLVKFYTDSYFTSVAQGPGKFNIAQWMVPGFTATLPSGKYHAENPWGGKFKKYPEGVRPSKFVNIEGWALDSDLN